MAADDAQAPSGADGGLDPRYDPAFQRGYRPQPGERPRTRVRGTSVIPTNTGTSAAAAAGSVPRSPDPVEHPAPRAEPSIATVGSWEASEPFQPIPPAPPVAVTGAGGTTASRSGPLDRLDTSPRTNRYFLALWIIGAGFVVLGIVLYAVSVFTSYTSPTPSADVSGLVFSQLGWMLAGPLVTVGLATLVALLLLTALTANRPSAPEAHAARFDQPDARDDTDDLS